MGLADIARQIFGKADKQPTSVNRDFELLPSSGDIEQDVAAIRNLLRMG